MALSMLGTNLERALETLGTPVSAYPDTPFGTPNHASDAAAKAEEEEDDDDDEACSAGGPDRPSQPDDYTGYSIRRACSASTTATVSNCPSAQELDMKLDGPVQMGRVLSVQLEAVWPPLGADSKVPGDSALRTVPGTERPHLSGLLGKAMQPVRPDGLHVDGRLVEDRSSPASAASCRSNGGGGGCSRGFLFGGVCLQPHEEGSLGVRSLEERIHAGRLLAAAGVRRSRNLSGPGYFLACLRRSCEEGSPTAVS
mmetsp:Transcript_51658/g.154362  ORF Transcript_51658/g.154362 Transcript_51658/m.154362 type:complete len:255 (-) Transcript_51658:109-873(-)